MCFPPCNLSVLWLFFIDVTCYSFTTIVVWRGVVFLCAWKTVHIVDEISPDWPVFPFSNRLAAKPLHASAATIFQHKNTRKWTDFPLNEHFDFSSEGVLLPCFTKPECSCVGESPAIEWTDGVLVARRRAQKRLVGENLVETHCYKKPAKWGCHWFMFFLMVAVHVTLFSSLCLVLFHNVQINVRSLSSVSIVGNFGKLTENPSGFFLSTSSPVVSQKLHYTTR